MTEKEIEYYTMLDGKCPYIEWRDSLSYEFQVRIFKRINRIKDGNFGDWKKAKRLLEEVLKIKSDDKPTIRMLEKMKKYNYKKPSGWIGNTE